MMPDLILIARVEQLTILFLEFLHLVSFMCLYSPKDRGKWKERNVPPPPYPINARLPASLLFEIAEICSNEQVLLVVLYA